MEAISYLVADPEPFELVGPGEGALDDPPGLAQAGAVGSALTRHLRRDAADPEQASIRVAVVVAVGEQPPWSVTGPANQGLSGGSWGLRQDVSGLADRVYRGAGPWVTTACKRPAGDELPPTQRTVNRAVTQARAPVERGMARLKSPLERQR